ncbi:GTP pyrophosphokinase [Carnobacterium funditum]|uniref:GTP pyrophosphokinase n=1 Tax=Carnobacterium funditum TaxID=2752 RepID=UPI001B809652|nr:GTP pyrophosphokinase family protein [Carnobacterium funditum]
MENDYFKMILLRETISPHISEETVEIEQLTNFRELMLAYNAAIRAVTTKLEILNDELSHHDKKNPIQVIKSRVKEPASIVRKLQKMDKDITTTAIVSSLNDVAGVRVVVAFIDDIYTVADMLVKQDDVTLIDAKDYVKNPKSNGYRSYHMIIAVPIFFSDRKQSVKVEVQIRTVAMDFWASLEYQLKYKENLKDSNSIEIELKECAETIARTDLKMLEIKNKIEGNKLPRKKHRLYVIKDRTKKKKRNDTHNLQIHEMR